MASLLMAPRKDHKSPLDKVTEALNKPKRKRPPTTSRDSKPGNKFTKTDRESVLEQVAKLDRAGFSQYKIGLKVGVSQPMISMMLAEIRERYKTSIVSSREERVNEELARLEDISSEALEAWQRSQATDDDDVRKAGEATFLRIMLDVGKARRELLGLDAPTKHQSEVTSVNIPWDQLANPPKDINIVEQKLAQAMPALPTPTPSPAVVHLDSSNGTSHGTNGTT